MRNPRLATSKLVRLADLLPVALIAVMGLAPSASAVTATWGGGTGVWSNPAAWSTNPLYPCNGQGGNTYEVVVGTGTVTVDLACTINTLSQIGTIDGGFVLEVLGAASWTGGTMGGTGTTRVAGGLTVGGSATKFLAGTRTLVQTGGTGGWSQGSITLGGGGATLRNEATWNITGIDRGMTDTLDTGRFENATSGVVNVDLTGSTDVLTLSPGTLENDGSVNVNVGILALAGDGSHAGSFAGAGTLRFAGGSQTLGPGANLTVSDLEVTSTGTLNVDPAATYQPSNTDVANGTLNVTDAADTITSGTATQSGGTLGGAGTFATTGSFSWTGGTMGDTGTTRVGGGLTLSGTPTKFLAGTRTLVQAGGIGGWSQGAIALGNGGATFRNEATWNLTGGNRQMTDTSNTGRFENAAGATLNVDLTDAAQLVTIASGTVENEGLIDVSLGILNFQDDFLQTAGALRLTGGRVQSTPPLDLAGGRLEGSGIVAANVALGGTLAPGVPPGLAAGQLDVQGTLSLLSGSVVEVELLGPARGSQYDTATVTGVVTLGGSLSVVLPESYRDGVGATSFIVLEKTTAGSLAGSFSNVASGERVFTPVLDSFVVQYGAGSPAGAERVVLSDYVKFVLASTLRPNGEAAGGTLTLEVDGIQVVVATVPGQTARQVAAAIAEAINGNPALRQQGTAATGGGTLVISNGEIVVVGDTDPGIDFGPSVSALSDVARVLLPGLLVLAGLGALRRTAIAQRF